MSTLKEPSQDEHTCSAIDDREANVLLHLILAEIRKSNAPEWVAKELERKLNCVKCHCQRMPHAAISLSAMQWAEA
jgi:hypothetical protein